MLNSNAGCASCWAWLTKKNGQREQAQLEFFNAYHKSTKLSYVNLETRQLRRECLKAIIEITKYEPTVQADYVEELRKMEVSAE
jgi:hypothetical protein